jgi:hypothetical protein
VKDDNSSQLRKMNDKRGSSSSVEDLPSPLLLRTPGSSASSTVRKSATKKSATVPLVKQDLKVSSYMFQTPACPRSSNTRSRWSVLSRNSFKLSKKFVLNETTNTTFTENCELECCLVSCKYLQALIKEKIATRVVNKYEEDVQGQLALQKDRLFKTQMKRRAIKEEIDRVTHTNTLHQIVQVLESNVTRFTELFNTLDLNKLTSHLNLLASTLYVTNVVRIASEEDADKLEELLMQCLATINQIILSTPNTEAIVQLAKVIGKFWSVRILCGDKQRTFDAVQRNKTLELFNKLSEMYAEQEKYKEN